MLTNISQFADDLVIWSKSKSLEDAVVQLNKELLALSSWSKHVELEFSPKKCVVVPFTRQRVNLSKIAVFMEGTKLDCKESAKYLGVTLDKNLCWKYHISDIYKKAMFKVSVLKGLACRNKGLNQ